MHEYDLVVIGSGPTGQRGAIAAAMLDKHVAVVERHAEVRGGSILRGTIPSKTTEPVKVQHASGRRRRRAIRRRPTMSVANARLRDAPALGGCHLGASSSWRVGSQHSPTSRDAITSVKKRNRTHALAVLCANNGQRKGEPYSMNDHDSVGAGGQYSCILDG
jgi:choline dehydrogenase-like flavoprotein